MPTKHHNIADRTLTLRDLNRALLDRQMLLERRSMLVLDAMEKIGGQHAQIPSAPYIGLWSRLQDFERDDLAKEIEDRQVVKASLMRGTLHFLTRADFLRLRGALQPVLTRFSDMLNRTRNVDVSVDELLEVGKAFLAEPRTFAEISAMFTGRYPNVDVGAMRQAVRMRLPLVQVPMSEKRWSYPGSPRWTLAETWLGEPIPDHDNLRDLFWRYLGGFGPATVADFQTWSGLSAMKDRIEAFKADLVIYHDEKGRELLDLPDAPLPDAETPAPVRLIGDLDNVMFGHVDRNRIIADEYRMRVLQVNAQGSKTVLVDGFVRAIWEIEVKKKAAVILIDPLEAIEKRDRAAIVEEAERVARFMDSDAASVEVKFRE